MGILEFLGILDLGILEFLRILDLRILDLEILDLGILEFLGISQALPYNFTIFEPKPPSFGAPSLKPFMLG